MHATPPAPPVVWTARVIPGWQVGVVWCGIAFTALMVLVPIPLLLLPEGAYGLAVSAVGTLLAAIFVSLARGLIVELRIDPSGVVARRVLGGPIAIARADVRDVVVATDFLQPRRYGPPLRSMRVLLVGHEGRSLLAATWSSLPFDPPAFFAMWRLRPVRIPETLFAADLERRVPGSTSGLERLAPAMLIVMGVLIVVQACLAAIAFVLRSIAA